MASQNTLHIVNYFPSNIAVSVSSSDWNCCDAPDPGVAVGNISQYHAKDLAYCRKDGHGCNGRQGEFALAIAVGNELQTLPLNFDSNGNIAISSQIAGITAYLMQIDGGTYNLALCPPAQH